MLLMHKIEPHDTIQMSLRTSIVMVYSRNGPTCEVNDPPVASLRLVLEHWRAWPIEYKWEISEGI